MWKSRTTLGNVVSGAKLTADGGHSPDSLKSSVVSEKQTASKGREDVQEIQPSNRWDPNLSSENEDILVGPSQASEEEAKIEVNTSLSSENSPYETVQAAVRNTDGDEVANTVRAWILGMFFVTIASGLNMYLSMRYDHPHRYLLLLPSIKQPLV